MKEYDYRFNKDLLQSFVGKTLNKFVHQQFIYTRTSTLYAGFMIDGISYQIENDYDTIDYFGWDGEATVTRLNETNWDEIVNIWGNDACITDVEEVIQSITVVNDHYSSFCYGKHDYDFWETRAIIFHFRDHELSFTKSDCWFSMEIEINKGNDLIERVPDGKFILDDFVQTEQQRIEVEREIIELS